MVFKAAPKMVLVKEDDMKVIQHPNMKLILKSGVSGKDGKDGVDGANGSGDYNSPTPIAIVDGSTFNIPAGKKLDSISVIPAAGDRVLTVGYSAGEGEVIDAEDISGNDGASFPSGKYFHNGITLHFSGFTGSVLIYLL